MSLQPRSKSATPGKAPKVHRKGTSAKSVDRSAATAKVSTFVKPGKPSLSKPGTSTNTPAKRAKNKPRSIERAKRFAASKGAEFTPERTEERTSPRATSSTKYTPARRDDRTSARPDTRPTTRRDARIADAARGDGRPNFVPRERTKFVPGGNRTAAPTTRSAHSGTASAHKSAFNRPSPSRSTNNFASRPDSNKGGRKFSTSQYSEDFGADDNYIVDVEQETSIEASHHTPNEAATKTFAELGIAPELVQLLTSQGINSPFPIQVATLPDALKGHDILGRGQTGSGKTLAFGLAMLTNLHGKQAAPHKPLGLILTPTRELAQQINDVLTPLAKAIRLDSVVIAGGMPYAKQITAMRKACPILVATPGRLIDLLNRGEVQLDDLQITVLDEADQMADMGFLPVVKEILDQARPNGQRLLFSATLDREFLSQQVKSPCRPSGLLHRGR